MAASVAEAVKHELVHLRLWVQIHFTAGRSLSCFGSNLRFLTFNVPHMKLKPKSMMESSRPGRGMAWWDRLRLRVHSPGKGGSNPAKSEVGREGAVSPLHVSQKSTQAVMEPETVFDGGCFPPHVVNAGLLFVIGHVASTVLSLMLLADMCRYGGEALDR